MPSLTVKGIPDTLLERLRQEARRHHRSLNSEVIHRLERSVGSTKVDPVETLDRIRRLRTESPLPPLTEEFLEQAIEEGRP